LYYGAPQIIYLVLIAITFVLYVILDGRPRTGKYSLGAWLVEALLTLGLLYWGGFFSK
jgi:hypothetical protein